MDDNTKTVTEREITKSPILGEVDSVLPASDDGDSVQSGPRTHIDKTGIQKGSDNAPCEPQHSTSKSGEFSEVESISEHILSNIEYSVSQSANIDKLSLDHDVHEEHQGKCNPNVASDKNVSEGSGNAPEPSKQSYSWPLDVDDVHISKESPINLPLESSDLSKDCTAPDFILETESHTKPSSEPDESEKDSLLSEKYVDSLTESSYKMSKNSSGNTESLKSEGSSGSEEIIKLDIRGQAAPKFPLPAAKIIFGPPPEGATMFEDRHEEIPNITNLLTPFLIGAGESSQVDDLFDMPPTSFVEEVITGPHDSVLSNKLEQSDLLIEELTVDVSKDPENVDKDFEDEHVSFHTQSKSLLPEETASFSTLTTDYKTICEEYHVKLVHLEEAISQRDALIEELTVSLQHSVEDRNQYKFQNDHLCQEVITLQHRYSEIANSEHDTVKCQLSDFMKYEGMVKGDDSTKFYSALMTSGVTSGSGSRSSNGEKDMEKEELTINFSRSDPKSSDDSSDEFYQAFEKRLSDIVSEFDDCIAEPLKGKFKEILSELLGEELNKIRLDYDTEVKELESQFDKEKQSYNVEMRRTRELLASVKAGNADLEVFRQELNAKHEKEMENLRTYFEKKCTDMEKNYSEDVFTRRSEQAASSLGSASSLDALPYGFHAAGDYRHRSKSADFQAQAHEIATLETRLKQTQRKCEQQLESLKAEHVGYVNDLQLRHKEALAALDEQIAQLKAHIQTAENTEPQVEVYEEDIDLELEKGALTEQRVNEARQEVILQLQEQIQALLADPDAELSSWPVDLVALRDKIHTDASNTIRQMKIHHEEELWSLRAELSGGEGAGGEGRDKWRRRRNLSFDQNRQIEEVTRERDGLKRVACTLQRVVAQLVAYCAAAEDELNRTVLTELLQHVLNQHDGTFTEPNSRASSPNGSRLSTGADLNSSAVVRGKRVHFAPDLRGVFADLEDDALLGHLQQQEDLSLEIKNELDLSLKRLRQEAQDLLDLSTKANRTINNTQREITMTANSEVQITELVHGYDVRQPACDTCELHKKHMEDAMAECIQREGLLRTELASAMMKIAQLMAQDDQVHSAELVAEGYGTVQHPRLPVSLPGRAAPCSPTALDSRSVSLDGSASGRRTGELTRLAHELETLAKERDDLLMQLEAANRQLRSTRQFVEEQTADRESERDDYAAQIKDLRDENVRLGQRLQQNARILNEVEQLEAQTKEMNQIIAELESRKSETDTELKATVEKIGMLRDIISSLESQLEQKSTHEADILERLEQMRKTIDERDAKMRTLLGELESLKSEKLEQSELSCVRCLGSQHEEEDPQLTLLEKVKEQARWLEDGIHRRTQQLERIHEAVCSTSCSEPSEDVSIRDHRKPMPEDKNATDANADLVAPERLAELAGIWDCLEAHSRAEDAALKRIRDLEMQRMQLKDVAQEVRAERDVLQQRMSEQALKISSLQCRLELQRNNAEALRHESTSHLSVQLHDALAEVQRLKEELESRDKQLVRLRQNLDETHRVNEQNDSPFSSLCQPKDKIIILERELASAQSRVAQLELLAKRLEADKTALQQLQRENQRMLAEKEAQLQELLAFKIEEENQRVEQRSEIGEGGKTSARTLSDIVSISDYDEQDLQMRKAEIKMQSISPSRIPYPNESKEKSLLNRTLPPDLHEKPHVSSLNIDYTVDHLDLAHFSPRADSLPIHFTSTQVKQRELQNFYKRNINETIVFGDSIKHSTAHGIPDNCSLFPNRELNDSKNVSIEPKKINFSVQSPNTDNRSLQEDYENIRSLKSLGINIDTQQQKYPDILTQLKQEIINARTDLENCRSELKQAEEQLCEFPALKEEVEELKTMLESTMGTMAHDKKFYNNQLDHFSSNKKLLEQQIVELTREVNEKSKDLHLLKEDILRRENMILELAKEKRNLKNKTTELEVKIDELQSKNQELEKFESENRIIKDKLIELQKMEQLVSEKNLQIDSLNEHLDRLDDMQRQLSDKTEELERLKDTYDDKSNELYQMQSTIHALNRDVTNMSGDNSRLTLENRELKQQLTKLEKEQENASLKLQSSESEVEKVNSLNAELSSKLDDLKELTVKLRDKECEIEILNEDINSYHQEIASLKEQLKMVSRSPSPRDCKSSEDKAKSGDRQASSDKKQLVKIRKQISLLQHELAFNKKDLNDKAFELARARLDVTELKNSLNQVAKVASDKEFAHSEASEENSNLRQELEQHILEKKQLERQLSAVRDLLREEGDLRQVADKLRLKTEQCQALEMEVQMMKEMFERMRESPSRLAILPSEEQNLEERALVRSTQRSPTAELENAVRAQLSYSHQLDDSIVEQILSRATTHSDSDDDVPPLELQISKSSSSLHSSSSEKLSRLRSENEKLHLQVTNLEARLKDKDALILELNRIRDKLVNDWQAARLRFEAEKDNSGRLQLLLDTQKETSDSLQNQDSNMIQILKKRLENAMESEFEMQQNLLKERARCNQLERQLQELGASQDGAHALKLQLEHEMEVNETLKGEVLLLKSKLEREKTRLVDLQNMLDQNKLQFQREVEMRNDQCTSLKQDLAELKRLKHEAGVELVRSQELLHVQRSTISELERRLSASADGPFRNALSEFEEYKAELSQDLSALKKSLDLANSRELNLQQFLSPDKSSDQLLQLKSEKAALTEKVKMLEQEISTLKIKTSRVPDDKDQAVRYLHGRCLRLESCRKALVWQKRYLQRVLAGYTELERALQLPTSAARLAGKRRFKCVAMAVIIVLRMGYLVRRRQNIRALSADCLFLRSRDREPSREPNPRAPYAVSTSPPSRERPSPLPRTHNASLYQTPPYRTYQLPTGTRENLLQARHLRSQDIMFSEQAIGDAGSRTERSVSRESRLESPLVRSARGPSLCDEAASVQSSLRDQMDSAALLSHKLDKVSRRLHRVLDSPRDVP